MTGPSELSATAAARAIAERALTSEALVRSCLDRIAAREDAVGAWAFLDPAIALDEARARDREPPRGPLHGVPVGIKDIIDTADMPTACGSPIYEGHLPAADAACVALLREAGAVILGKTVTTEFAAVTPGKTANPRNLSHTPGGSSSGSAAAVADLMVPLAIGTQTVGSVIRPSAYCGVIGFKPSYGAFSLAGVKPQAESLDTLGFMVRAVEDLPLVAGVLAGAPGAFDAPPRGRPPRIGFCRSPHWTGAEPATVAAMERACATLAEAGARIEEVDLPDDFARVLDAQWTILRYEFARVLSFERTRHRDGLSERLRGLLDDGMACPIADYQAALALAEQCRAAIAPVFARHDVLLTPSAAGEAPRGLNTPSDLLFQRLWTVLRLPCLTLPAFTGENGLPVGVQLVGGHGRDAALLSLAAWVDRRLGRA